VEGLLPGGSVVEQWEIVLSSLRRRMTEQRFTTWFRPIEPRKLDAENLTLEVPNPFFIDW
jgi:chromosomal replication initiator protein